MNQFAELRILSIYVFAFVNTVRMQFSFEHLNYYEMKKYSYWQVVFFTRLGCRKLVVDDVVGG